MKLIEKLIAVSPLKIEVVAQKKHQGIIVFISSLIYEKMISNQ